MERTRESKQKYEQIDSSYRALRKIIDIKISVQKKIKTLLPFKVFIDCFTLRFILESFGIPAHPAKKFYFASLRKTSFCFLAVTQSLCQITSYRRLLMLAVSDCLKSCKTFARSFVRVYRQFYYSCQKHGVFGGV